jgi:hypothetical protein
MKRDGVETASADFEGRRLGACSIYYNDVTVVLVMEESNNRLVRMHATRAAAINEASSLGVVGAGVQCAGGAGHAVVHSSFPPPILHVEIHDTDSNPCAQFAYHSSTKHPSMRHLSLKRTLCVRWLHIVGRRFIYTDSKLYYTDSWF